MQCSQRSGAPSRPSRKLPGRLGRTGGFGRNHGPDEVRQCFSVPAPGPRVVAVDWGFHPKE